MIATLLGWLGGGRGVALALVAGLIGVGMGWVGRAPQVAELRGQVATQARELREQTELVGQQRASLAQLRADTDRQNAAVQALAARCQARSDAADRAARDALGQPPAPVPSDPDELNRLLHRGE